VLPFTGLELLAVGAGLYVVVRRGEECEVITLQGEYIIIERGRRGPQQRWQLARAWARVVVERHPASCYPCRLLIRSYGRAVEIGRFLSGEERQRLAVELQHSL
ncbi:MAG TPA: DUF2244 domain-containing protein, partial [Candidatus Competibacteraceae bacterium]|nr:DUF2244 domain-containing protein [Candidatus Competibacteraceae bacterium]